MIYNSKFKQIEEIFNNNKTEIVIIDVRSENEFLEDHIPLAINMPVLTNLERAEVGTLYKSNSFEARQLGARIISKNLPKILAQIEEISEKTNRKAGHSGKPNIEFVIYCWRGGMRSRSLFTVMDLIGYKAKLIDGGYKTYRKKINEYFLSEKIPECVTIYGPSGSGKSEILKILNEKKFKVLPLETFANHKGSILGGDFLMQPSQKKFESKIYFFLNHYSCNTYGSKIIVEGESRNIGKLTIPEKLFQKVLIGENIWIELPIEERAKRLSEEYVENIEILIKKVELLKKYISSDITVKIIECLKKEDRFHAAYLLLEHHYDVFYKKNSPERSSKRKYKAVFQEKTFGELKKCVVSYFENTIQRSL
ncbi:MAG: tRNA 2-selenouridine(34) synthase MnmH [Leptospiraceae bacterium]|nr:tRNA 2-selenouridine(34) synthase MnmH [Leptospiraceae bacterium]MCK6381941.1 tRNA 2-selenouridine(34) synthase MnmH [Leptospiraceae bacterium]NUM42087.1 tRNA 2-selenouridine(34) synthase MnmH [Leptospiraceae bacterium]